MPKERTEALAEPSALETEIRALGNKVLALEEQIAKLQPSSQKEVLENLRAELKADIDGLRAEANEAREKVTAPAPEKPAEPPSKVTTKKKDWLEGF